MFRNSEKYIDVLLAASLTRGVSISARPWSWAAAGESLIAIDSGDTIDYSANQLWELQVNGATATWINSDPDAMDDSLSGAIGVSGSACDDALFLGSSTFRLAR